MDKIKKNYALYVFYNVILLCFPLITFPYVSRVLGVENYGLYDYRFVILNYFLMFAKLGIINYGTREVAENSGSRKKLGKTFRNIYLVQFILTSIVLVLYVGYCVILVKDNLSFNLLYCLFIVANYFNIAWFYQGVQNFKSVALRNLFINLISLPCIFIFVRSRDDLIIYVLVLAISQIFGNAVTLFGLKKYFSFKDVIGNKNIFLKKHLFGMLILFVPILATNIYTLMDELMLGNLSMMGQVGLYACAMRIMYIPLAIITPLSSMMLPYISAIKSKGKKVKSEDREKALLFTIWIGIACAMGLFYIAPDIIELFFSEEYIGAIVLIKIMAFYTFFYSLSQILRDMYFLPNHKDNLFVLTVFAGIPINLSLNILMIPKMGAEGAAWATIISEFLVLLLRLIIVRKEINWKYIYKDSFVFVLSAVVMYFTILIFELNVNIPIVDFFVDIIICVLVYLVLTGDRLLKIIKVSTKKS